MSEIYIQQYKILYQIRPTYGMTSIRFLPLLSEIISKRNYIEILDYGCGKSQLLDELANTKNIRIYKFDPAIDEFSVLPKNKMDFVICTDVLQHIPENELELLLKTIKKYSSNCFFHIKCSSYPTLLPNGQFANCTIHSHKWWKNKLSMFFDAITQISTDDKTTASFLTNGESI